MPPKRLLGYETLKIPYTIEAEYIMDFEFLKKDGSTMCIEAKGNGRSFDQHTKRKMINARNQHPDLDIRIVFYSDGKIGPKRKDGTFRRQSDWANDNGFKFAIREIPEEWLNE